MPSMLRRGTIKRCSAMTALPILVLLIAANCPARAQTVVTLIDMIPRTQSNEVNSDSEPNLAVNPANPLQMAASAFTLNTSGIPNVAPIYLSADGGLNWVLSPVVPVHQGNRTNDITLRFAGTSGVLYISWLDRDASSPPIFYTSIGSVTPFPIGPIPSSLTVLQSIQRSPGIGSNIIDQPYVQATSATDPFGASKDRVYVGGNDHLEDCMNLGPGYSQTARVDISLDAAAGFNPFFIDTRKFAHACSDLPSIRPAIHGGGTVYAAFFHCIAGCGAGLGGMNTADVVVVRDDNWAAGTTPFGALLDTDGQPGVRVVQSDSLPDISTLLGSQRIGSNISIAVDPNDSQKVYLAWGDGTAGSNFMVHVRSSSKGGASGSWSADLKTVTPATNPALAVNSQGKVGLLYQKWVNPGTCHVTGGSSAACWETHLEIADDGITFRDSRNPLANVPDSPGDSPMALGDYDHMMAVGNDFYGVFSANNYPDSSNFFPGTQYQRIVDWGAHQLYADAAHTTAVAPSVDPFFFKVTCSTPCWPPAPPAPPKNLKSIVDGLEK